MRVRARVRVGCPPTRRGCPRPGSPAWCLARAGVRVGVGVRVRVRVRVGVRVRVRVGVRVRVRVGVRP